MVNLLDDEGTPLIILAANTKNPAIVRKLIEKEADVNATRQAYFHSTALMESGAANDTATARLLLEAGAEINKVDTFGDPAINWASYYGHIDFVDLLLKRGARWDVQSRNGTAIDIAMKEGNDRLIEYYIRMGAGKPLENPSAMNLLKAVKENDAGAVRRLLSQGADPDLRDELDTPALVIAASLAHEEILRLLLAKGADPDLQNRVGQSALARAALFGHTDIVRRLLDAKADVESAGKKYNLTPLISAAMGGDAEIGRLLIRRGAQLNAQDGLTGFTPLMFATAYGHVDFVKMLIQAGANPYVKSFDGTGLYDMLSFSNNPEIAEVLREYVMNPSGQSALDRTQ